MDITAKVKVVKNDQTGPEHNAIQFYADYTDERNKEWAYATPSLQLSMTVIPSVAEQFKVGEAYTLTFTPAE